MESGQNGKWSKWRVVKMESGHNGMWSQWNVVKLESDQNGKRSKWKAVERMSQSSPPTQVNPPTANDSRVNPIIEEAGDSNQTMI